MDADNLFFKLSKSLFWFLTLITLIGLALGGFYFYQYLKGKETSLEVQAPREILTGVPFEIKAIVANKSEEILKDAKLNLVLPSSTISAEEKEKRVLDYDLGDIDAQSDVQQIIKLIPFQNKESLERYEIVFSYYISSLGSKARFENKKSFEVAVRGPAIRLDLTAPQKVLNNEEFEIRVDYKNVAPMDMEGARIELVLPPHFTAKSANPLPNAGANKWLFPSLKKSQNGAITLRGVVLSTEQSFFEVSAAVFIDNRPLAEKAANISIAPSPLALEILLNDQTNYIAGTNDRLRYLVNYRNNSDTALNDVVIKVKLSGEMFDFLTLQSGGSFNSKEATITWNASNITELQSLNQNAGGSVNFEIKTKENYPARRLADKNFVLKVSAEISSPTVPYYVAADKTISLARLETKVKGAAEIQAQAFYFDPSVETKNKGPLPPRAEKSTTYTIHWKIVNRATDIRSVEIKSTLPQGVKFLSNVKSNSASSPSYNERTSEIIWSIDKIPALKGVIGQPIEAIFQIEATPNIIQIGQPMPLLNETTLSAVDDFTDIPLNSIVAGLTTAIPNDTRTNSDQWKVQQ